MGWYKPTSIVSPVKTPLALGTNNDNSNFELDGTLVFVGEATVWDDLRFPLQGSRIDVSAGRLDYNYFNGGVDFANNARYPEEPVSMICQLEHKIKYDEVNPHIHWLQQSGVSIPNWLLAYKILDNGTTTTLETDFSNYNLSVINNHVFTYTSGNMVQISGFPSIDVSSLTVSDFIHFVLFRDSANTSTLFSDIDPSSSAELIFEFDLHVEIDTIGSREEYIK